MLFLPMHCFEVHIVTVKRIFVFILLVVSPMAWGDEAPEGQPAEETKNSPWFVTPLVSSDPKISTAAGAMAGYVHHFDEKSPPSVFGLMGTYSTTDSWYAGGFGKAFFGEDKHRVVGALFTGEVRNDYSDFLGTGLEVQTTDDFAVFALRYSYRMYGNWFLGSHFVSADYAISGDNVLSGKIIDYFGLTGFRSSGLGLYGQYDTRDNQYSPSSGQAFEVYNIAFRESFGGDASFDSYTAEYQFYLPHGKAHVLASRLKGRWTDDAPSAGYSSVDLRGYTQGQYLAEHMSLIEFDERISLTKKLGAAAFAGVAVLYGTTNLEGNDRYFPAGGGGLFYQLNEEKMVVRADVAFGKDSNYGFYLTFGHPY